MFKKTVPTPQKTHYYSITKANSLMLFRKTVAYCDNDMKHKYTTVSEQQYMLLRTNLSKRHFVKISKDRCTHLLQCLLVGYPGALQQPDHILSSLHHSRLDPQPVSQFLHALFQWGFKVRLISFCTEKIINVIINLIGSIATYYHPPRPLPQRPHTHGDEN